MWIIIAIISGLVLLNGIFKAKFPAYRPAAHPAAKKIFSPKNKLPDQLVITTEFQEAFDLMENTSTCVYITGKAGTGKSTLLTYFRQKTKKNCVVLAPTGIAALHVEGATIQSFFRFAPTLMETKNIQRDDSRRDFFQKLDMIIIDEVSMVRADMLDGIDYALRIHRGRDRPFGGVQMMFFGDLYQLPPVVVGKDMSEYFDTHFGGSYFFNAKVFTQIDLAYRELQTIFRQKDEAFKKVLNRIRENNVSAADLDLLNSRYHPHHAYTPEDIRLTLTTTNQVANAINGEKMNGLRGQEYVFPAVITGTFDVSSYPTDPRLSLKQGAQVILLKNDPQKRWANGSLGVVDKIREDELSIALHGTSYTLDRVTWEGIDYEYNTEEKKIKAVVTGSFSQFPVKPAWAITIHKSQGQTFDGVIIDLGSGAFAHGQTYVALSRCPSLEGIVLKSPIRQSDIILDDRVKKFIQANTAATNSC